MEKHYSSTDRSAVFDRDLSLPHFDEEATLLSARPVVPLDEVKLGTQSKRRRLIFGLTILAAILVGATSAILLMENGQDFQTEAGVEHVQPEMSFTGAAGGSTSTPVETRVPLARESDEAPPMVEVAKDRESSIKKREPAAMSHSSARQTVSRTSIAPVRNSNPDESTSGLENDERELRRAERRDARRDARRQDRDRRERMGDDVLRIREIFEGSPRP